MDQNCMTSKQSLNWLSGNDLIEADHQKMPAEAEGKSSDEQQEESQRRCLHRVMIEERDGTQRKKISDKKEGQMKKGGGAFISFISSCDGIIVRGSILPQPVPVDVEQEDRDYEEELAVKLVEQTDFVLPTSHDTYAIAPKPPRV